MAKRIKPSEVKVYSYVDIKDRNMNDISYICKAVAGDSVNCSIRFGRDKIMEITPKAFESIVNRNKYTLKTSSYKVKDFDITYSSYSKEI